MAAAIRQPGWYRAAIGTVLGAAFGFFLVVGLRLLSGLDAFQTEQTGYPQVIVPLITTPFAPSSNCSTMILPSARPCSYAEAPMKLKVYF